MDKLTPTGLKITSWNANGLRSKKRTFIDFLENHKTDVALVQETFLKPSTKFTLPNYRVYRTDRLETEKGGTLIAVKEKITLPLLTTNIRIRNDCNNNTTKNWTDHLHINIQ